MKSRSLTNAKDAIKFVEKLAESVAIIRDCSYIESDTKIHTKHMMDDVKHALKYSGKYDSWIYLRTRGAEISEKRIEELHDEKLMSIHIEVYNDEAIVSWGNK